MNPARTFMVVYVEKGVHLQHPSVLWLIAMETSDFNWMDIFNLRILEGIEK